MVTLRAKQRVSAAVLAASAVLATTSCGSETSTPVAANSVPTQSSASTGEPTPPASTPFIKCEGLHDPEDAIALIETGKATALVEVRLGKHVAQTDYGRTVSVDDSTLLAGDLPAGAPTTVELEPIVDGFDPFPPGQYVVLLSPLSQGDGGDYFVANGLRGSFMSDSNGVFERCPNFKEPTSPITVRDGITDRDQVVKLFDQAFSRNPGTSSSPSSSSSPQ